MVRWINRHIRSSKTTKFCCFPGRLSAVPLLLFFIFFCTADATAAKQKVIFQLANLKQWAELEYTFEGSSYSGDSEKNSQSHEFGENYHLEIDYAILGRRLANGSLELDLGLEQNYETESGTNERSGRSNGFNLEYKFDMLLFERQFCPVTLYSSRHQERINAPFTQDYDLISSHFSSGLALMSRSLPLQLNYHRYRSETAGLDVDRIQDSEELRLNAYLETAEISTTEFQAKTVTRSSHTTGPASDTATDSYSLEGRNVLDWQAFSQRQVLYSTYRMQRDSGTSELSSGQWDERLNLRFGKALESGISYADNDNETPLQFRREKKREFWIGHQLFKSVTSRFQHNVSRVDFNTGSEDSWRRQINVAYSKLLSKDSRLRLAYSYSYGETDRDLDSQTLFVGPGNSESATIDNFWEITLQNPDVLHASIVVRDSFGLIIPEASNYTISVIGRLTKINFLANSWGLAPGDGVTLEYEYLVNNSIEYSTTVNAMSASLDFLSYQYRLYGNLSQTDQDLIAGDANVSPLIQQRFLQLGVEANLERYSFGGNYSYLDSTISTEKYVEAFFSHQREKKNSVLNLRLTERYSTISQKEGFLGGTMETTDKNSLMLNVDYRKQISHRMTLTLKGLLSEIRRESTTEDEISLGMLLESRWYKFLLRVNADVSFQFYADKTTQDEQVSIALRRYF